MARIRTLKPDHGSHRKIGPRSDRAYRIWAAGLVTQADDEGRLPFSLAEIRAKVYAYHPGVTIADIQAALQELLSARLLVLYETDAGLIIQLHDWEEHQRVDRPKRSSYPAPDIQPLLKIVPESDDSMIDLRGFDERSPTDRDSSSGKEGRKEGRKEGVGLERSSSPRERSTNNPILFERLNGWPQEWEPIKGIILGNPILSEHYSWIVDLAFWQSQDMYFKREGVQLDQLLEGAAAHMVKEGYRPTTKKGFRQKIGNLMRVEARIQRAAKK